MLMNKLKYPLLAVGSLAGLVGGLDASSALAGPVQINPTANNGGLGVVSAADPSFFATQSGLRFTSDLQVDSAINAAGSVHAVESGSLLFTDWGVSAHGLLSHYNVYGVFSIAGNGHWSAGTFTLDGAPTAFSFSLFANPNGTAFPTFHQATQSDSGVANTFASDFLLAGLFINGFNGSPTATFTYGGGPTSNSEQINAALGLNPAPGTSGATGFWENLVGAFNLNVGASASSNNPNGATGEITQYDVAAGTDSCPVAECVGLSTHGNFGSLFGGDDNTASFGNGTLTYDLQLPEPATLGLFGFGLLGLGFISRRRKQQQG